MLPDLTQYMWIAWLVLAILFVIVELLTLEFTFLMLAAGTLIGGLGVNLLGGVWWLQILAAAAISAAVTSPTVAANRVFASPGTGALATTSRHVPVIGSPS